MNDKNIQVGDWVSFYSNGTIVIGMVIYVVKDLYRNKYNCYTNVGIVNEDNVLEVRKSAK